jgi:hypothetical protein
MIFLVHVIYIQFLITIYVLAPTFPVHFCLFSLYINVHGIVDFRYIFHSSQKKECQVPVRASSALSQGQWYNMTSIFLLLHGRDVSM